MNANIKTPMQGVVEVIKDSVEGARGDLGAVVHQLVEVKKLHPLGVSLALSICATTLVATSGACGSMPRKAVEGVLDSMFSDARTIGLGIYDDLMAAMNEEGLTPEQMVEKLQKATLQ